MIDSPASQNQLYERFFLKIFDIVKGGGGGVVKIKDKIISASYKSKIFSFSASMNLK